MNFWERNAEKSPVATFFLLAVAVTFVLAAIGMLIWGLATGFSYLGGQGDAYRTKNSSQNWVTAQRSFHQEQNDVIGYSAKIQQARDQITAFDKAHPNLAAEDGIVGMTDAQAEQTLSTTLTGLRQQCVNTVNQYNTDAQSYLTMDWRDADLPDLLSTAACN